MARCTTCCFLPQCLSTLSRLRVLCKEKHGGKEEIGCDQRKYAIHNTTDCLNSKSTATDAPLGAVVPFPPPPPELAARLPPDLRAERNDLWSDEKDTFQGVGRSVIRKKQYQGSSERRDKNSVRVSQACESAKM